MRKTLELWAGMTGTVLPFAGSAAPNGWLLCFGQAVSRTTYATLFAVIGTTYGSGDGSTTFNVPDLRGRVSAGKDNMGGTPANRMTSGAGGVTGTTLGAVGGNDSHTLTTAQIPAHNHTGVAASAGAHTHESNISQYTYGGGAPTASIGGAGMSQVTSSAGAHSHALTIDNAGGGGAHPNVQPTIVLNSIIKA